MRWIVIFLNVISMMGYAQYEDSKRILEKLDAYRVPYERFLIRTKITTYKGDKIDETAVFDAYIDGSEKSLVIAKKYRTKDMKILYVRENMWVHLPGSRRPIRITPIQRLMGEASNGDIARVSFGDDYSARRLDAVSVNHVPCHRILLEAKKKSATYNKIILYARQSDYRPVKAEFYLISGKHFKTAYYQTYEPVDGQLTLKKMTIFDEVRKGQKTIFEYPDIQEKHLPVKYFNKNYLIHIQGL